MTADPCFIAMAYVVPVHQSSRRDLFFMPTLLRAVNFYMLLLSHAVTVRDRLARFFGRCDLGGPWLGPLAVSGPPEILRKLAWVPSCAQIGRARATVPTLPVLTLGSSRCPHIARRDVRRKRLPVQLNFPSGLPGATGISRLFASGTSRAESALIFLMNSLVGDAWLTKPGEVTACFHPLRRDGFPFGGERRGNGK